MSRTKRWTAAACLMCLLVSCALAEDLIAPEDIVEETANYKTYEVFRGEFIHSNRMDLSEYYPLYYDVPYEGDPAHFVEFAVSRGDQVKKGDLLARLYYDVDEVRLESLRLSIARAREALEEEKERFEEESRERQQVISQTTELYQRRLLEIEMERRQIEHEQSCFSQEYAIARQQEELDELETQYAQAGLYSPMDGVVEGFNYRKADELVYDGQVLITINNPDVMMLTGSSDAFRFGMDVAVELGRNQNRERVAGRVVCADNILPEEIRNGRVYVMFEEEHGQQRLVKPTAWAETVVLRNVLLADRKVAVSINGVQYVYRLEDDMPKMRSVTVGKTNPNYVWILQGVSEGEMLIDD